MTKINARVAATILATSAIGLSACGDESTSSSSSASETTPTSTTSSTASTAGANTTEVVAKANAFLDTLSEEQRSSVVKDAATTEAASSWSNLPAALSPRQGVYLGELSSSQQKAALALLSTALSEQGAEEAELVRQADDYLGAQQANGTGGGPTGGMPGAAGDSSSGSSGGDEEYDGGNYFFTFYGEPSETDKWLLQYTGHHLTYNITYEGDQVSFGPQFAGVEPISFEESGETIAPLSDEASGFKDALDALTDEQKAAATLDASYDDLLLGAGKDSPFPTETEGVTVSELSEEAQEAITATIRAYVMDLGGEAAEAKVQSYIDAYDETKFAFTGGEDTEAKGFYARIDGPVVWIEISTQNGIVLSGTHYHSIYREQGADYGGA